MTTIYRHVIIDYGPTPIRAPAPLFVSSTTGMRAGDTIEIMLDNGELFTTTILAVNPNPLTNPQPNITITNKLPHSASAGNIVVDLTQSNNVPPTTASDIV